jgi:hemerythrin-like domain-containing protein
MTTTRITGPLATWYDLHEAIRSEIDLLDAMAQTLDDDPSLAAFAQRFRFLADELRTHSLVEDGILFAALQDRGLTVDDGLVADHRHEQESMLRIASHILSAQTLPDRANAVDEIRRTLAALRPHLHRHLDEEERVVLPLAQETFSTDEQATLLRAIITLLPADPHLQAWVAESLTPEHRDARLRNLAHTLSPEAAQSIMREIRDGVSASTWVDITTRTPEVAALAE